MARIKFSIFHSEGVLRSKRFQFSKIKKSVTLWLGPTGVILVTLLIVVSLFFPKTPFQKAQEILIANPENFEALLILTKEFIKNNQFEEAEKTLELAQNINPDDLKLEWLWQQKRYSDPNDIRRFIVAWQIIAEEKADCRDCAFQLAFLHAKLYQDNQARDYLARVFELDPNFKPARELEKILKKE